MDRKTVLQVGVAALAVAFLALTSWFSASAINVEPVEQLGFRQQPVRIKPTQTSFSFLSRPQLEWLGEKKPQLISINDFPVSPSLTIHLIKCFGTELRFELQDEEMLALDTLLNQMLSEKVYGHKVFVETRVGVRYPTLSIDGLGTSGDESHRDQCMASLGEFGLPVSTPLIAGDKQFTIKDVLRDSVANFQLDQQEIEWTLLAYSLYFSGQSQWTNRFGESFTFDEAAEELMSRPIDDASCGGTHRFYTLNAMLRSDQVEPFFSPAVRHKVQQFIRQAVVCAVQNQEADGSWKVGWNQVLFSRNDHSEFSDERIDRLVMTGHLAEWFLYLPDNCPVDPSVLRKSSGWLSQQLNEVSKKDFLDSICPYTHAFCSLSRE